MQFNVALADKILVQSVGMISCRVGLGLFDMVLTFYVLDYLVLKILGIPFLSTVNPVIDWKQRTVSVYGIKGLQPLQVVVPLQQPQCTLVSGKQFERELKHEEYKYQGQLLFTHHHAHGESGGDEVVDKTKADLLLEQLKRGYPEVFAKLVFPIRRSNLEFLEHKIELKDERVPPPRRKLYPLDPLELAELKNQLVELLESNRICILKSLWCTYFVCQKERWEASYVH